MTYQFRIEGRLDNLNDFINADRTNRYKGAVLKAVNQQKVVISIRNQLRGLKITKPVRVHCFWNEKNKRRDPDNVSSFGRKVIHDALVECGVLKDDGWDEIAGTVDVYIVNKNDPHIDVMLEEVD